MQRHSQSRECFDGPEAERWLQKGLEILSREIPEQILADGGHFERSPMYHAIILEDMLDLINAAFSWPECVPAKSLDHWKEIARGMFEWLAGLVHPDGDISFFNDSAFAIAPTHSEIGAYANRLQINSALRSTGNFVGFSHRVMPAQNVVPRC